MEKNYIIWVTGFTFSFYCQQWIMFINMWINVLRALFSLIPCQLIWFLLFCCNAFFSNGFSKGLWVVNTLSLSVWIFCFAVIKKILVNLDTGFLMPFMFLFSPLKLAWHLLLKTSHYCWEFKWSCTCLFLLSHLYFLSRSS